MDSGISDILKTFIPQVEGFSPTAHWDNKQWSWGYGTAAGFDRSKRPIGSISRDQALMEAITHFTKDYYLLAPKIKIPLTSNQWAAYLSFSYNEGIWNAEKLLQDINDNSSNLQHHWMEYIFAGGHKSLSLAERRKAEWDLWNS